MGIYKNDQMVYVSFVFLGFINLIPWNVMLTSLDFFDENLEKYDPSYYFPFFYTFLSLILQIILLFGQTKITYFKKIIISLVFCSILMIFLPIASIYIFGFECFLICSILVVCLGLSHAVFQSSLMGICSFLPIKFIIALVYGSGFAGVVINVLRFIFILLFDDDDRNYDNQSNSHKSIYCFYSFSVIVLLGGLVFVVLLFKNPWFIHNVTKGGNLDEYSASRVNDVRAFYVFEDEDDNVSKLDQSSVENSIIKRNYSPFEEVKYLMRRLYNLNFLIFANLLLTLIIFPAVLFNFPLFSIAKSKKYTTVMIIYNVFDSIGKICPVFYKLPLKSIEKIILFRLFFFVIIGVVLCNYSYNNMSENVAAYLGILMNVLISISNGYFTTLCYVYAPQLVDNNLKGKAGRVINLFLTLGVFTGSCFSTLITQRLLN